MESRIRVFTGHFGSGKTEIALNYALNLAAANNKVCIADLDIVNPYFCTRDEEVLLKEKGIRLIASPKDYSNAELGTVPQDTAAAFNDKSYEVVLDVGGDEQGAVALGQYNRFLKEEEYDMYFVINTTRPFTSDADGVIEFLREIEKASRLKVKYLINNTNLSYETTPEIILKGQKIVEEVSEKTSLPIAFTTVREDLIKEVEESINNKVLPIKIYMLTPWRKEENID